MIETRHTDATGILIGKIEAYNVTEKKNVKVWGHFEPDRTRSHGAMTHVGPWYKSKAELLADHDDYMVRAGWLPE